jgi:16S rRNA processing protein RimM
MDGRIDPGNPTALILEVGRIVKPHGLLGELVVESWSDVPGRFDAGAHFDSDRGALTVATSRAHQGRMLCFFDGIESRSAAETLRGTVLRAHALSDPDVLWVHELVGSQVVDVAGFDLGRIVSVEANPASDLLVLEGGVLIPLTFVQSSEPGVRVVVTLPEGLLDP